MRRETLGLNPKQLVSGTLVVLDNPDEAVADSRASTSARIALRRVDTPARSAVARLARPSRKNSVNSRAKGPAGRSAPDAQSSG